MKKAIINVCMFVALALVAGHNVYSLQKVEKMSDIQLSEIEALAACEVSSDPTKNKGICVKDINDDFEYCASLSTVWATGPACSKTIR